MVSKIAVKALLEFSIRETMEYFLRKYQPLEEHTASEEVWYFLSGENRGEYNITLRLDLFIRK